MHKDLYNNTSTFTFASLEWVISPQPWFASWFVTSFLILPNHLLFLLKLKSYSEKDEWTQLQGNSLQKYRSRLFHTVLHVLYSLYKMEINISEASLNKSFNFKSLILKLAISISNSKFNQKLMLLNFWKTTRVPDRQQAGPSGQLRF